MQRRGLYHAELLSAIGRMGHGDIILIGDVGCPFPRHEMTTCIDLAVSDGVPRVKEVLRAVLGELVTESYIISQETKEVSSDSYEEITAVIREHGNKGNPLAEKTIAHTEMKNLWLNGALEGEEVKVFVRTGERTPYGYVALVAGVDF